MVFFADHRYLYLKITSSEDKLKLILMAKLCQDDKMLSRDIDANDNKVRKLS